MSFQEALQMVVELAESAILEDKECDTKELYDEQARQIEALNIVQEFVGWVSQ